jgi:cytochrome c5
MKQIYTLLLVGVITVSVISCAKDEEGTAKTKEASTDTYLSGGPAVEQTVQDKLAHGEKTHNVHCYKCHTDEVYTRENRFVKSIDALSKQVVRCKDGNDIPWFEEDTEAVVQFLNNKYYRF